MRLTKSKIAAAEAQWPAKRVAMERQMKALVHGVTTDILTIYRRRDPEEDADVDYADSVMKANQKG